MVQLGHDGGSVDCEHLEGGSLEAGSKPERVFMRYEPRHSGIAGLKWFEESRKRFDGVSLGELAPDGTMKGKDRMASAVVRRISVLMSTPPVKLEMLANPTEKRGPQCERCHC